MRRLLQALQALLVTILGLTVLGWVASRSGPRMDEVVIHVNEPEIEITLGARTFHVRVPWPSRSSASFRAAGTTSSSSTATAS